ncbi:MAG: Hsp33 family molecular chaperone HslO, partial [Firmicutes bacterium]|nr:Hsp33 family molecular chaperone HslO [Bacillota bacterium]
ALVSGEIAEDLTAYYYISEQQNTAISLGVKVDKDWSVKAAGGLFIQMLPGAAEGAVDALENMLKDLPPITTVIEKAVTENPALSMEGLLQKMMDMIFGTMPEDFRTVALSYRDIRWECDCSYDRLEQVLASIGEHDLRQIAEEDGEAELTCQFCLKKYHFGKDKLLELLDRYEKGRQA